MKKLFAGLGLALAFGVAGMLWHELRDIAPDDAGALPAAPASAATLAQGAYLARAGNCIGCHTARGGAPLAGGLGIATPFGTIYSPNLTPDARTGIGSWSAGQFWRALHHGRSRDGRLLYPAFPYTDTTHMTRSDSDALYAWLRSQPAVPQPNRPHALRFPYGLQVSLAAWRLLYFTPGGNAASEPGRDAAWQRGAYLVRGPGHCGACHTPRDRFAGSDLRRELQGAMMAGQDWYAPALAGLPGLDIVKLLKTGHDGRRAVSGPMAEVVHDSTQYLRDDDLAAIAVFLQSLPAAPALAPAPAAPPGPAAIELARTGGKLYERHCVSCHGADGRGVAGAYPALAGNRAVLQPNPANLVQVTLHGGFAPTTAANPRPYGMPPFAPLLNDAEVAAVLTYIRGAWGNNAAAISEFEVRRTP